MEYFHFYFSPALIKSHNYVVIILFDGYLICTFSTVFSLNETESLPAANTALIQLERELMGV